MIKDVSVDALLITVWTGRLGQEGDSGQYSSDWLIPL